jgi:hypothetical protein
MRDDDTPTDDETAAELSRAAREAVRQQADPRIDRQLARMGLAPEPDESVDVPAPERAATRSGPSEDVEGLRASLAEAQSSLELTRGRLRVLNWVIALEGVTIAILALLLLLR